MSASQRVSVRVRPRASQDRISSYDPDALKMEVRVKAAPVDNAANEAMIRLLSKALKLPQSKISIVAGAKSRDKIIEIGANASEIRERLTA